MGRLTQARAVTAWNLKQTDGYLTLGITLATSGALVVHPGHRQERRPTLDRGRVLGGQLWVPKNK